MCVLRTVRTKIDPAVWSLGAMDPDLAPQWHWAEAIDQEPQLRIRYRDFHAYPIAVVRPGQLPALKTRLACEHCVMASLVGRMKVTLFGIPSFTPRPRYLVAHSRDSHKLT